MNNGQNNPNDISQILNHMRRKDEEGETQAIADELGMDYASLVNFPISPDALAVIPYDQAVKFNLVGFSKEGIKVNIATSDPYNIELKSFIEDLTNATKFEFSLAYCSASSIRYALSLYKVLIPEIRKVESVVVTEEKQKAFEESMKTFQDLKNQITKVSTTELLDIVFAGAIKNDATDIHLEPQETNFRIRFRIDGVLQEVASLPSLTYKSILSRVKYLSKLKMDMNHPQDGRFTIKVVDDDVDIRVATLPSYYGEAVVMRLLPKKKQFVSLENLGFSLEVMEIINKAISKPQGMILATGPTGSGKTTTLYAMVQKLNQPGKKIITLEDPIEYRVDGIQQIQIDIDNQTGFLEALKGSLRQDPDILVIGEIRDKETANIALQAAMTGHLVLSTLHTNNAPSSLARLQEMDIEPYLLAGSINLIIAQRLVRLICKTCNGAGCDTCHKTGFKGRTAVIELLVPGPEIEKLIYDQAPIRTFEETAHLLGMKTMYEDGLEKVTQGITTKEEVERVTQE